MKITCNSCGSKYTIADAKVQGKKVKVRCKGCKESILVDGTLVGQGDATIDEEDGPVSLSVPAAAPAARAPVAPSPALWSVNISDDDSREMSIDDLRKAWADGVVTSDAYVWKDGMGDWKPILEVGELKHKLGEPPKKRGVVSSAAVPVKPVSSGIGDLFGADAAPGGAGGIGGLGGLGGHGSPDGGKPTGARNDSSVLFSLDSLTSNAEASGGKARANAADIFGGMGPVVGSLGANPDLLTAPAKDPPPAPAGFRSAGLDPEAGAAKKGKGGLIAAILGAAVIVGGGFFFMSSADTDPAADEKLAAAQATAEEALKKAEEAQKKAEADRKKMEADLKTAREEAEKKDETAQAPAEKKAEEKKEEPKEEQAAASSPSDSPAPATSPSPSSSPSASPKPAAASGSGPFNVNAAKSALSTAAANAASCKKPGGPTGSGKVQVTFAPSGRVTSANVLGGSFGGTPVGGCVASTFRRAKVPAFSGGSQTVSKSFNIP